MRSCHLLIMLSLFLLVPASIIRAQKVSVSGNVYEKGTVKNKFTTPNGAITITLPDDIRPGDHITGTVVYEPEGRSEKEKNKNKIGLLKYSLSLEPDRGTVTTGPAKAEAMKDVFELQNKPQATHGKAMRDVFELQNKPQATMHGGAEAAQDVFVTEFTVPATYAGNNLHVILRDPLKNVIAESSLPILGITIHDVSAYRQQERIFVPDKKIYMAGEQALILYPSASSSPKSGSLVYLNRSRQKELSAPQQLELQPLVSSPRQTVVSIPNHIYGPAELEFKSTDGKIISSEKIHVLELEASCPKTSLLKGESTVLNVKVNGVKDCPAAYVRLSLDNATSNSVKMGSSNHEDLMIYPGTNRDDVFTIERPITALRSGNFNIDISLSYPSSVYSDPVREHIDFINRQIQDISFPKIDAGNSGKVHVMSVYYPRKGSLGNDQPKQKNWSVNNFRFEMDGLPGKGITKIDGFNITPKNTKYPVIKFEVPLNDAKPWLEWLENKSPKNGTIQYQDETNGSYITINLKNAKPVSVLTSAVGDLQYSIIPGNAEMNYSEEIISSMSAAIDPGRVLRADDLVAVFNPFNKKLLYNPEYKNQVFEKMNPRLRADGRYDVSVMTNNRKMISMVIDMIPGSVPDLVKESEDSIKYDKYGFESTGEMIKEHWDSAGSYRFYKNAICKRWKEPSKGSCMRDIIIDSEGKIIETGKSSIIEATGESHCYKGTEFCTEMYIIAVIEYQYDDADCKRLVNIKKYMGWSCE